MQATKNAKKYEEALSAVLKRNLDSEIIRMAEELIDEGRQRRGDIKNLSGKKIILNDPLAGYMPTKI